MEDNVVAPVKPIFYKRYVDDTYVSRKNLLKINSLKNLTRTMTNFLDTYIVRHNSAIKTKDCTRSKRFPVHCSSRIPLRYKPNAIRGELHRANKIGSSFSK